MAPASGWFLLLYLGFCVAWMDERPVLESRDGHLIISSAKNRNITLKIIGGGFVNVNEINLLHVASAAQNATRVIDRWRMGYLAEMENSLQQLTTIVTGPTGLQRRVALLERNIDANGTNAANRSRPNNNLLPLRSLSVRRINMRIKALEDSLRDLQTLLRENECQSNPCQNGGTCEDLFDGYQCHCPSNWEGPNCQTDVNECARFYGTDLGCQNGATCHNSPGSYRCDCLPGWFGLHCTQKTSICNTENSEALCGEHGLCVAKSSAPLGYTCICDQGWESDGTSPACTRDVDECAASHPPCSVNPRALCLNTPGSFTCGPCPHGYSGNGYYCADIDECLINNGGCSISPYVQCMNTMGSRVCGPCPPGYRGDGISCIFVGGCAINNGGCHPLATCTENPSLTSSYVLCHCPPGYIGNGMGPNGCQLASVVNTACFSNPCLHGTCVPNGANGFTCTCNPGYTGTTCNMRSETADPCWSNPCRNSGTCVVLNGQATCQCTSSFTGNRCETPRQTCGGVIRNPIGTLQFPMGNNQNLNLTYQDGLSCAWVLITDPSKVLNVTFTAFSLENSRECKFDFLQIHDGKSAGSQMINRFCGNTLPNGNGNIISSHNTLYLWFHSDNSENSKGFTFYWNSIDPVCGGDLEDSYGTITSPGSPGRYPPNRNCLWRISIAESKRIQFHFGQVMLEGNCSKDYLEILGTENERLGLYCNHTRPPPLITPSSEATVIFHSDSDGQDAGFQIHYSLIEGIPGCGGTFTTPSGIIHPPGRSTNYQPNMECEWKIQLPADERIKVTWSKFELEESYSCQFDFVEIYDGPSRDSQLLGRYCGVNLPPSIKSTSNTLVVIFKSDWSNEMEGFVLSYEMLCGGEFRDETGIIKSPNYPESYHGSKTCIYEIIQPTNKRIVLTIEDMEIEGRRNYEGTSECYFDYLEIYDGDSENSTKLATLCGEHGNMSDEPYYSTYNYMYLKFTTDSSIENRGFKANYTTLDRRCGGLMKETYGVIQPPIESGEYVNNEDCIWTIHAPPGYIIQLSWLSFHLETHYNCINDYVKLYENYTSPNENVIATYCGENKPPDMTTESSTLTIVFHTDSSVTYEGFVATYSFADASKVCGGHYSKSVGIIRSPNYPNSYPNDRECVWIIEAENRHRIILTVEHFELEKHTSCDFDYLEIRNGGTSSAPLIDKYCGTNIPTEIPSQTNKLYIKFFSDFSRSMEGFEIRWDSTTEGCGGTLSGISGDIMSPNYPEPYAGNADCYWKIAVAAGSLVEITIVDLELESNPRCRFDFIEISDGTSRRTNKRRYCDGTYPQTIQSTSNKMTIRFRSDYSVSARGFHIQYETRCHNKLNGAYGVIESPNFPNKYTHSTNCSWTIEAPIGNTINLTFSHFDLEGPHNREEQRNCAYDYLQIMEGEEDIPNTELGRYCGTVDLPLRIHSTQHQVFITFITDSFIAYAGFRLEWIVHGCVEHIAKPYGAFTSPGYPSSYPTNINCEWLIEVDHTHSVELTFYDINTEKGKGCSFDKIQIYGGEDENAPKLDEICYSDKPMIYTSSGNKMFVKFYSDVSYAGRGFNVSYRSVPLQCGGKFTSNSGVIHSANYPQNYPFNQNCEWLLEVDSNYLVNLTFTDFDIENTRNCSDDHVQIFDGPTMDDDLLLGSHCGNTLPPTYISRGNQMLVVMRTDNIVSAKGFMARFRRACGARIIVKDHGFLTPSTSYNNEVDVINCTWTLIAENPGDHVTVTFTHMELDPSERVSGWMSPLNQTPCFFIFLRVYEGEDTDSPLLGSWCNNVTPPPVTSTGSSLTLHLFSQFDFMSHFVATYSALNTACGGNYTSEQGMITSPGYPNSYPLNAECIWILNTSPGNKVTLTFLEFDVESSENCDMDYLEVRENSGIGKLISVSCGKDVAPITSTAGLWIKFKSDGLGTAKGFLAEYNYVGGNELEGPTGRITSPLYPMPYRKRNVFSWRVTVEMDSVIRIEFRDIYIENFGTECSYKIEIFDGYDEQAPRLLKACGYTLPDPVQSLSNVVFIRMESVMFRMGSWFDLTWLQVPRQTSTENKEIKLSECNKEIALMSDRNNMYAFSSPGWPTGYAGNLHCNWVFTSPPGTHLVLRIITMDLEETSNCVADAVSVYSGYAMTSTSNANLESRLCLSNATLNLIQATNVMTVKFDTDSYVNKTGFNAYVYRDCGGQLTDPNGVIEYDNSSVRAIRMWQFTCEWNVTVRPGKTIKVQITEMSINAMPDHSCGDNYLLLRNGNGMLAPLLGDGKYCGDVPPWELETTGNHLYVKAAGRGPLRFKLSYREMSMTCGGEFVFSSRQKRWNITTPNYPSIPPTFAECTWIATAPAGETISIHFLERFDLSNSKNCEREYVEIRDGGTDNSRFMGRYCKDVAPSSMTTIGNMMYIHFYTDVLEPKNGFKAELVMGEVCGGILRGTSGVIESPLYPHEYPTNQNCSWLIIGPTDHTLKLQFRDIRLPGYRRCSTDYVRISERLADDTTSVIGTYCGLDKPDLIETSANEVYVYFKSDNRDYMSYTGFSINFTASQETCGGILSAMSGIIKSPGYPNPRTRARYCDWRIMLPVGYHVVVNILDLDAVNDPRPRTHGIGYALSFYNDLRFKSKIKVFGQSDNSIAEEITSSSNTMIIGYWSSAGHRGFKLRYRARAPAPCGGTLRDIKGNITGPTSLPFNETSFFCNWEFEPPEHIIGVSNITIGHTLTIKFLGDSLGATESVWRNGLYSRRDCIYPQYVELHGVGKLCGNMSEMRYLRSPQLNNQLSIMNGTFGRRMDFNLQYQWQACGGILQGPSHTITPPRDIVYPINCVWYANYPESETINAAIFNFDFKDCNTNYLIVKNGGAISPQIARYCGPGARTHTRYNISSISNQLWIEYFASDNSSHFEMSLETASTGCGGSLRSRSRVISSPEFPKQYPNNGECIWEIIGDNGYHIGLSFVDRFNLETSPNCEKDYVEVFDWIRGEELYTSGEWKSLGKVCGRNTPPPFNSTSNRMKVIFRSNEAIQSDGFRAVWSENCGGIFQATDKINIIQSPSYPNFYPPNAYCNYTILAPNDDIIVEFTDFQLERGRGDCRFDNVTVISENLRMYESVEVYCSNTKPPLIRSFSRMQIIFMTDKYLQRSGYQFRYFINKCGGIITQPAELKPLMHGEEYFGRMNCTWIIKAPQGKSVLVRFEKFVLEFSTSCYFDNVAVYEGDTIQSDKRIALVCSNLTEHLPTFKSESSSMVVNFNADNSRHYAGFVAKVLFTTNPADGCGGTINMTSVQTKSFGTQQAATYKPFEECHWTVKTSPGKTIRFTINSMDIKNSTGNNVTRSSGCTGDYLEIRDGGGLYSELLGQFCGTALPRPVVSTSNLLWIRFYTDGTYEGAGATATLDVIDSICGLDIREVNTTTQVLTSPGYPDTHTSGIQCRWTLTHPDKYSDSLRLRFIDFDMPDTSKCDAEYLEISENKNFINEGFGSNFIFSGERHHPISVEMGSRLPYSSYKYCGRELPHDYYSYSNNIQVTFKLMTNGYKGFKLEYGTANCDRNYTSEQGRILHHGFTNCWISITAPANHTISLYFNQFRIYDADQCVHNALQVHDGDSSGPSRTLCSITLPSPIFSTGNKLTLHSWTESPSSYQSYDIIYTTTDAGPGCGGRIFNFGGRFTSPLYPNIYRKNTVCTWDVSVPRGFKILLEFLDFDIGTTIHCDSNNLKIYDVNSMGESLRSTYCGGDDPARVEADGNRVLVKYTSTVNNIGTGWVIAFMAQSTTHPIELMDRYVPYY